MLPFDGVKVFEANNDFRCQLNNGRLTHNRLV